VTNDVTTGGTVWPAHQPGKSRTLARQDIPLSTPGGTRTPNLLVRSQTLYPIELRALGAIKVVTAPAKSKARPHRG
jgi:hypothetical protein